MAPTASASVWPLIFQFLEPEDLVSVSAVCFSWWQFVFRGSSPRALRKCEEIDLAYTGTLYKKVPLKLFTGMTSINLHGTGISTKNFLKLVTAARRLRVLVIENCGEISESAIFKAKDSLRYMTNINVSYNAQFSVLAIACLCSYPAIQEICANGLSLEEKEILFLSKTFPRLVSGKIDLQTETTGDGDYFFDIVDTVADEELFDKFF